LVGVLGDEVEYGAERLDSVALNGLRETLWMPVSSEDLPSVKDRRQLARGGMALRFPEVVLS